MKAFFAVLISVRGLAGLFAAILLSAVVWFFAPALFSVNALWLLLLLSALPVLIWIGVMVFLVRRAKKRDAALVAGVTEVDAAAARADAAAAAANEEQRAVAGRLAEALAAMKAAGGGKGGYLYERPWYLLIGPPGSGKTTAIRNSGLEFPLAEGRVAGVGGTRNCDWWIAEQAVLIDTAGRYTTQDSDSASDKAGWERFLDLLRRERPQQPLNGVIVAFGADMISQFDDAQREQHAQAVRSRVRELETKLGQRLPVYLLVSKSDLVLGFTEYFDDLDRDARQQVWGMTFAVDGSVDGPLAHFDAEYKALLQRLQDRVLERLQAERGQEQRGRIAGFPGQFASLQGPLASFVKSAFGGSKLNPAPFLRGVYFSSGTQEGTPIDRLTGALSRTFGIDSRRPAAVMGQKGRSYFLGRLLRDVVFNEARLASHDPKKARRQRLVRGGVIAACLALLLVGAAGLWRAFSVESDRAQRVATALEKAEQSGRPLKLDSVTDAQDLVAVLPYLDEARLLSAAALGGGATVGLSQADKLVGAGELSYQHTLERVLLPRLLVRLEDQIRQGMQKPSFLYLATRIYLMLGRQGPLDAALIKEWMGADWAQLMPGVVDAPRRDSLARHLDALLGQGFQTYPVDGLLVDQARRVFSRLPMAERVYARLRNSAETLAPWRPAEALGLSGQRLFAGASDKPLSDLAVPGLYTVEGLHRSFLPRLPQAMTEAASEGWVLGPEAAASVDPQQMEKAILELYAADYITAWDQLLASLELAPFATPTKAAEALNVLGAPNSPLRDLLQAVSRQLSPGTAPAAVDTQGRLAGAAGSAASAAGAVLNAGQAKVGGGAVSSRVAEALGAAVRPAPASVVAALVEDHFKLLREASGKPLDAVIAVLNDLYLQVAKIAATAPGSQPAAAAAGLDVGQRLRADAQRAPEPLARWLLTAADSSSSVRAGGAKASVAAAAAQQLGPFCNRVETRFPFRRQAGAADMPMDDFARLFGPGGAFDTFFAQNLQPFVDTSQRTWRPLEVAGSPSPVSASDVVQFQRASVIRNAFFPPALPGQASKGLQFELVPLSVNGSTAGAVLEVDGVQTTLPAGAVAGRPLTLTWPARGRVSLTFVGDAAPLVAEDGPWAALRFVSRGRLQSGSVPDKLRLTMDQGPRTVEFELRTSSIVHPFALRELAEFSCPRLKP